MIANRQDVSIMRRYGHYLTALFFTMTLIIAAYTIYDCIETQNLFRVHRQDKTQEILTTTATALDAKIDAITHMAKEFAYRLEKKEQSSQQEIEDQLKTICNTHELVQSAGIAYCPFGYKTDTEQYFHLFSKKIGTVLEDIDVTKFYDYTKATWYATARMGKQFWLDPYTEIGVQKRVVRLITPFFDTQNSQRSMLGVIVIDVGLDQLHDFFSTTELDKNTYSFLMTSKGVFIAHPTKELIDTQQTIFDLSRQPGKRELRTIGYTLLAQKSGQVAYYDTSDNKDYTIMYTHLKSTGWIASIIFSSQESLKNSPLLRHKVIHAGLSLFLFIFALSVLLLMIAGGNKRNIWLVVAYLSGALIAMIVGMWWLTIQANPLVDKNVDIVDSKVELARFFEIHAGLYPQFYITSVPKIPTGMFLYALSVPSDTSITANMYTWQKYHKQLGNKLPAQQGLTIVNAENESFNPIYTDETPDTITQGWQCKATVKGIFDYTCYPFDKQRLTFFLSDKSFKDAVFLVPDFASFKPTSNLSAEIDPALVLNEWVFRDSYFAYTMTDSVTDFGIQNFIRQKNFPVLTFIVYMQRNYLSPLIASLIPIIIIIVILFSTLLIFGIEHLRTPMEVIKMNSTIFFATALAHQTFKRYVNSVGISYLEYFYFVIYAVILLVTINLLLYASNSAFRIVQYKDNFIVQILYWPVVLTTFLVITLAFFY